jgi:hypothetical protein
MIRHLWAAAIILFAAGSYAADTKLTLKVEDKEPPKELSDAMRALLDGKAMNVFEGDKLVCTVWAVKGLESKATVDEARKGLKYANVEPSTVIAAVKLPAEWRDYRKQKVKAGVYTLRLGIQPMDGDHQGTAPFNEFCLLCPADQDKSPETLDEKELFKLSAKTIGRKHPSMMLLFPNKKPADAPVTEDKPKEHYVLSFRLPVTAGGEKMFLGFSLVVIGETASE